jgi:apolipoprotein N-acyltransferase
MVKVKPVLATLVAVLILSTASAPLGIWLSLPLAYAIYLKVLIHGNGLLTNSFLFGFISSAITLSWSKTFVGVTPWFLLCLLQGLYLIPVGFLARYKKNPFILILAILVMDEAKGYFPFGGFGWTRIAFSQVESPYVNWVSVLGVIGLSLLTLMISLALVNPNKYLISALVGAMIGSPFLLSQSMSGERLNIRAVQGGVPERGLSFNARAEEVLNNHIEVTLKEFRKSDDLIIWPENSIDVDPIRDASARLKIEELQRITKVPLLAGAILNEDVLSNSAVLFDESGTAQSIYIKRYLTPFGEYIPLRDIASLISPHVERVTDFTPGESFIIHSVNKKKISTIICYEILSDQIFRESALNSELMAVLTNSATFSGSSEGEQQLNITRIRAIESGRNIVSVSTTGPSAFIDFRGQVLSGLDDGEVGSISRKMELRTEVTIASQYGGVTSISLMLFALIFIGYSLLYRGDSATEDLRGGV